MALISRLALWTQPDQLKPTTLVRSLNIQQRLYTDGLSVGSAQQLLGQSACNAADATKSVTRGGSEKAAAAALLETAVTSLALTNYAADATLSAASRLPAGTDWDPRLAMEELTTLEELETALASGLSVPSSPGSLMGLGYLLRGQAFLQDAHDQGLMAILPLGMVTPGVHVEATAYARWSQLCAGARNLDFGLRSVPGFLMAGNTTSWQQWDRIPELQDVVSGQDRSVALRVAYQAEIGGYVLAENPYTWFAAVHRLEYQYDMTLLELILAYLKGLNIPGTSQVQALLAAPSNPDFWLQDMPAYNSPDEQQAMLDSFIWLQGHPGFAVDLDAMRQTGRSFGKPTTAGGSGSPLGIEAVFLLTALTGLKRAAALLKSSGTAEEAAQVAAEARQVASQITFGQPILGVLDALAGA